MYTGTLIDDLMAAVERVETHAQHARQEQFDNLLDVAIYEMVKADQSMAGAA